MALNHFMKFVFLNLILIKMSLTLSKKESSENHKIEIQNLNEWKINCSIEQKIKRPLLFERDKTIKINDFFQNKNLGIVKKKKIKNEKLFIIKKCVKNLRLEEKLENIEEKNWTCKIIKDKATNIPLICSCSHQYECTETKEYHFSSKYKNEIKLKNQLMKINRGADFQCEKMLKKKTLVDWICELEKNQQQEITNTDEEYFCKCLHRKMCTYDRYVDIF